MQKDSVVTPIGPCQTEVLKMSNNGFGNNALYQQNTQSALGLEEELYLAKLILDHVADVAFGVQSDAQFVYVNDAACRALEHSRKELLSMMVLDIDLGLSQQDWSTYWQTIKQQGSLTIETRYQAKGGQIFPVEISFTYVEFQGRGYSCALARNIAQRDQGKDVLLESIVAPTTTQLEKQTISRQRCVIEQCPELFPVSTAKQAASRSIFPCSPRLSQVFHFIEANYHQSITLYDVAQAVGYSSAYLTNLVRRQTGQTVYRWIIERRMAEARSLLLETNQPVEQIAQAVGYQNVGHFFHVFRQFHGMTPKVWRTKQQAQVNSK